MKTTILIIITRPNNYKSFTGDDFIAMLEERFAAYSRREHQIEELVLKNNKLMDSMGVKRKIPKRGKGKTVEVFNKQGVKKYGLF